MSLEPLDRETHGRPLFETLAVAPDSLWTYMSFGPFRGYPDFESTLKAIGQYPDWVSFAVVVGHGLPGFASYLRIAPGRIRRNRLDRVPLRISNGPPRRPRRSI